jgi:hypothetical protein
VVADGRAAHAGQERRDPDAGAAAGVADPGDQAVERGEAVGQGEPVADLRLPPVVDLDHLHRQVVDGERGQVLVHVGLGDLGEVVVPGAPGGGRRPGRGRLDAAGEAVAPAGEQAAEVRTGQGFDRAERADGHPAVHIGRPDGGDLVAAVDGGVQAGRRAVPGDDAEQPLALEAARRGGAAGPVGHGLGDRADRPERGPVDGVRGGRAPALPAVLVHPRPGRFDRELVDNLVVHGDHLDSPILNIFGRIMAQPEWTFETFSAEIQM